MLHGKWLVYRIQTLFHVIIKPSQQLFWIVRIGKVTEGVYCRQPFRTPFADGDVSIMTEIWLFSAHRMLLDIKIFNWNMMFHKSWIHELWLMYMHREHLQWIQNILGSMTSRCNACTIVEDKSGKMGFQCLVSLH